MNLGKLAASFSCGQHHGSSTESESVMKTLCWKKNGKGLECDMIHQERCHGLCDHLEGWDREGGREMQEGGDTGIYVYV